MVRALQRLVNRTTVRNFEQPLVLVIVKITLECDRAGKFIDLSFGLGFSIPSVHLVVGHIDADVMQRLAFAARVHADRL